MKTQIKGRNVTVTEPLHDYASEKIERVHKLLQQRRIDEVTQVELELRVEKNPRIAEPCIAEATVFTRGPVIRASESAIDMYAAIDLVIDKLVRRVRKYLSKLRDRTRHGHAKLPLVEESVLESEPAAVDDAALDEEASGESAAAVEDPAVVDGGRIVKTKRFVLKPMSPDEATFRLELVGHDFFVFTNVESGHINVVYRRGDGNYGLIEPMES